MIPKPIIITATIVLAAVAVAIRQSILINDPPSNNPTRFSSYKDRGIYTIDPRTILANLDQGKTNVFTQLLEDQDNVPVSNDAIGWTQSDYLKIATALSQHIWNEPLVLKDWKIYNIAFEQDCVGNLSGFNVFSISYYKIVKVGWTIEYSARFMRMEPWHGVVWWGGNRIFTAPSLFGWHSVNLTNFKIPAETALQIVEENGGKEARLGDNKCGIYVSITPNTNDYSNNWVVNYFPTRFKIVIDPFSGNIMAR